MLFLFQFEKEAPNKIFCSKLIINVGNFFLRIGLWFFALIPIFKWQLFYIIHLNLWIAYIIFMVWYAFSGDVFGDEYSVNGLLTLSLFITQMLAHLTILFNSFRMRKCHLTIGESLAAIGSALCAHIDNAANKIETITYNLSVVTLMLIIPLVVCHTSILYSALRQHNNAILLYWHSFGSTLALQFKTLEFLCIIKHANSYEYIMVQALDAVGELNFRRVFQKCNHLEWQERTNFHRKRINNDGVNEMQVFAIKQIYSDICGVYKLFNDCYGWSLLAFTLVYFNDLVSNSYYIFLAIITQELNGYVLMQNGGFVLMALILLWELCWICQQSGNNSRKIGCLICKLVKPLGNKRYNDVVTEFSLQTLHQRFIITAKDFFTLNLNLLGGMVAAIVTYLVILIQFMFAEKNNKDRAITILKFASSTIGNTTATALSITNEPTRGLVINN